MLEPGGKTGLPCLGCPKRIRFAVGLLVVLAVGGMLKAQAATDLGISPRGHYITYKGEPLLLVGDSGTQVVTQNVNINHRQWIDDCAARGIRAVHVWAFLAPRQKQDGSVIESRYGYVYPGITPWARKTSGPNATDQLKQWDLKTFDEGAEGDLTRYWPRLRDMCGYAAEKDMVVGITIFFGWPKWNTSSRPDWSYHPLNVVNGGPVTDSGTIVTEVQMIESPGTEVWAQTWSDAWSSRKKTQWIWERLCKKYIDELNGFGNVFFVFMDEHSYSEGNGGDHFMNFFRSRDAVWVDWNARRSGVSWVMSDTLHSTDKNSNAVAGFGGHPVRPYLNLEGPPYMGDGVRTSIWSFVIGGGHYFFHADEGQETVKTGIMGYDPYVIGGDKGMYKRDWVGHASRFFNEHVADLDTLAPHNALSSSGTYCLADPGREYVVYSNIGASTTFNLDLSAGGGVFDCRFYNPRNGQFGATFQRQGGQTVSFTKPDSNDWILQVVLPFNVPVAVIRTVPDPAEGFLPLTVNFDASDSYVNVRNGDPRHIVSYAWDFTDDGTYDEINASPTTSHVYPTAGTYTCRLQVTDNEGMTGEATVPITVRKVPADFDGDGDVDLEDFGFLQRCYGDPPIPEECLKADLNNDGFADQADFEIFRSCLSGANMPADPACVGIVSQVPVWHNALDNDGTSTVDGGVVINPPSIYVTGAWGNAFAGNAPLSGNTNDGPWIAWDNDALADIFDSVWDNDLGTTIDLYFFGDHWETHTGHSGLWGVWDRGGPQPNTNDGHIILAVLDGTLRFPWRCSYSNAVAVHLLSGVTLANNTVYRLTVRQLGTVFEVYLDGGAYSNDAPVYVGTQAGTVGFPHPNPNTGSQGREMAVGSRTRFTTGALQAGEWVDNIRVYNGYFTPAELDAGGTER